MQLRRHRAVSVRRRLRDRRSHRLLRAFALAATVLAAGSSADAAKTAAVPPAPKIPSDLAGTVEHASVLEIGDEVFTIVKVERRDGSFAELAIDTGGKAQPAARVRARYVAGFERFGKIHPTLARALARAQRGDTLDVMLWLDVGVLQVLERTLQDDPKRFQIELAEIAKRHRGLVADLESKKAGLLANLKLDAKGLENHPGTPFVIARLDADSVEKLATSSAVHMLLLHEREGREDLEDSLSISGADDLIAAGVDGDGIRVAVWENCPDSTSSLSIEASFTDEEGISCSSSQHARHTTGIIKNTTETSGFAPKSTMFSADKNLLDALDWAIDDKEVSVLNQSFHRSAEIGDGMQADDLYKDFKILQYPWPTIVQAAGNWCPPGTSCDEGGADVLDEFVNHKGFNSISIGNHNDGATEMSGSSCFVNPTSPHGDRELPELAANGTEVTAVGLTLSGTSMASPAVVGSVALLQDARSVLRIWPEANRALLFAGSNRNVPHHAGQRAEGGDAADAPNTWWRDVSLGNDAFDGAGALNVKAAREIARTRYSGTATRRAFDIGTLRASSFDRGLAKKSWKVKIPDTGTGKHVKVALAWNSTATVDGAEPAQVFASVLGMDLDLRVIDSAGHVVARSASWDNSYEIADFDGKAGETYTIRVRGFRIDPGAWSWFGIAWDVQ